MARHRPTVLRVAPALLTLALITLGQARCRSAEPANTDDTTAPAAVAEPVSTPAVREPFESYLQSDYPPVDGLDFPVGDADAKGSYTDPATGKTHHGWYLATVFGEHYSLGIHPGEDWNGRGGGNTDRGQPVHSVGHGRVVSARQEAAPWGNVVVIEHLLYENHQKRVFSSVYAHLARIDVAAGDVVQRRQVIGSIGADPYGVYLAHLHLELRSDLGLPATYWPSTEGKDEAWVRAHYLPPTAFIEAHREAPRPAREAVLVHVDQDTNRLRLYERGTLQLELEVAFGQRDGRKRRKGDERTPKGMYHVVAKHRGEMTGDMAAYYGGHWIKINYPNPYDAAWGVRQGLISEAQAATIRRQWEGRSLTAQGTPLGGGIGFHGWIDEWEAAADGTNLSLGCLVLHQRDIGAFYERVPVGAMVVIR